jgi:hypothetical protein
MKYTINGKEYTEFDINKRCAELMVIDCSGIREEMHYIHYMHGIPLNYCDNSEYTWPIIEKCWDELMDWCTKSGEDMMGHNSIMDMFGTRWEYLIDKHNCTKLVAACICFIEFNDK